MERCGITTEISDGDMPLTLKTRNNRERHVPVRCIEWFCIMDDYEICDDKCEKCGHWETRRRDCTALDCEEGYYHDCGEDCCCCLHPEPNRQCDECQGHGVLVWCPNCGWEPLLKSYMNGKDQREFKGFQGIGGVGTLECGE